MADAVAGIKPRALPDLPVACRLSGLEPLIITPESMFVNVGNGPTSPARPSSSA